MVEGARGPQAEAAGVLVVDDELDIRDAIKDILEHALKNVHVYTAESGDEGLGILRNSHIDLIVSDYKMPGMNGLEFLQRARRVAPRVPRILITAFERELADELAPNEDALVLTKPLDPRPLIRTCEKILAREAE